LSSPQTNNNIFIENPKTQIDISTSTNNSFTIPTFIKQQEVQKEINNKNNFRRKSAPVELNNKEKIKGKNQNFEIKKSEIKLRYGTIFN
jgi:hypothetical protein